ncbi:PREDICTED: DNA ligase 4 [Bactrocera latifrons]|uniref:DNA ligase 4 n=1 Tax=Bactrocera latifrons TaxID=174628 RepID=UPI0008DDAE66|nr:PREDICTED: DNA ligase 4 [Bactrocera latifrons]
MDISKNIKFCETCTMLQRIQKAQSPAAKEKLVRHYYESFQKFRLLFRERVGLTAADREDGGTSFYCILRCLVPREDMSRKAYGLQVSTLGSVYTEVLQLNKDSRDAKLLQARTYNGSGNDFAEILHEVLLLRADNGKGMSELSLYDVHQMLDTIAEGDRQDTKKVLTALAEVATSAEQMWFVRLLLKNLRLGIGEQRIFALIHPQARDLLRRCSDLKRVCCLLANNEISKEPLNDQPNETKNAINTFNLNNIVQPFQHIKAMLCEMFHGSLEQLMAEDVLYLEIKMDGERFQLHYENQRFKYISRNGIDYTDSFGEDFMTGSLTPLLQSLLPNNLQSIILDGEMMVYDMQRKCYRDKGENTDVKHLNNRQNWRPCFVIYDVLYYNGSSLLEMPYVQRCQRVVELISKEEPGILQIMRPIKLTSAAQFQELFQQALDAQAEGVVLKKQNSIYQPGIRNGGGWYKIKADYITGLTTEFDLLIIGGFYNKTRTFIQSFLLGVLKYNSETQYEIYSVGKVDNRTRQRAILNDTLRQHWHDCKREPPPSWYHYKQSSADGRPDVWIEPNNSVILQIRATDLAPSSAFALSKSLHFPRVEMWRNDKLWYECLSLHDYMTMLQGESGLTKIHKRQVELSDLLLPQKKRKLTAAERRKLGVLSYERRFDPAEVKQRSNLFEGFSFCILSASLKTGYTPEALKALVVTNGGEIVENPLQDPTCISVAGDITFRVATLCKSRRYSIAKLSWLVHTCEKQELELTPIDMICTTDELEAEFSKIFDKYGDSYRQCTNVDKLMRVLEGIRDKDIAVAQSSAADLAELETLLFDESVDYFTNCNAAFYSIDQQTNLARLIFTYFGGKCLDVNASNFQSIKYVLVNINLIDKVKLKAWIAERFKNYLGNLYVINIAWIFHSQRANRKLDILEYTWSEI